MIAHSATLAVNELVQSRRKAGEKVIHLGFGEAGLPVAPCVAEVLADSVALNSYGPVAGTAGARDAAAGYFSRRGLATTGDQIIFAPGSKSLLFGILASLPGDVILPQPSWVTYAAQAALLGKKVVSVPTTETTGGVPDPEQLERAIRTARRDGADPQILVLTLPDNPTGTLASPAHVKRICEIADAHGLFLVSDEIYRDLCYEPSDFVSPASHLPDRTVITTGLSKNLALGGWRIGFARLPEGVWGRGLRTALIGVASEVWSSLAMPMQSVAEYVLQEPLAVTSHISDSARLHRRVASEVYSIFADCGFQCRPPQAAFYLYPDLELIRPGLESQNVRTGAHLAKYLLDQHGIAVLAGVEFGDKPEALRFRVATGLLYGEEEEQRWEALRSPHPNDLPWIRTALEDLRKVFGGLASMPSQIGATRHALPI